jgi:thiamine-monophosphate kinase
VGADLWAESLPVEAGLPEVCAELGLDLEELLLAGGDDYVLLFTLPPRIRPPAALRCCPVGTIVESRRVRLVDRDGSRPLAATGWDHFA